MVNITKQQTGFGLVDNQADIPIYSNRSKIRVFRSVNLVKIESRIDRVGLQVERCRLDRLPFFNPEFGKTVDECV